MHDPPVFWGGKPAATPMDRGHRFLRPNEINRALVELVAIFITVPVCSVMQESLRRPRFISSPRVFCCNNSCHLSKVTFLSNSWNYWLIEIFDPSLSTFPLQVSKEVSKEDLWENFSNQLLVPFRKFCAITKNLNFFNPLPVISIRTINSVT